MLQYPLRLLPLVVLAIGQWASAAGHDRSPVDLVLSADQRYVVTANETSDSVSLVEIDSGRVIDELSVGEKPAAIARVGASSTYLVTSSYGGQLTLVELADGKLRKNAEIAIGAEPFGVVASADGKWAYVAQASAAAVAVVDLAQRKIAARIAVGNWPRQLALSGDGKRLAVGTNGELTVSIVDVEQRKLAFQEDTGGINMGQMQVSADGQYVYLPWMVYRHNPITVQNIKLGWVLGSRIGRVRMAASARREAITLDPPGMAVSDPHGLALTSDEKWLVASGSGTHELLVYRLADQKFQSFGGPGDHIDQALLRDKNKFYRLPLDGRPMNLRIAKDDRRVFVANYLLNAVQEVDLDERALKRTINLGGEDKPSLARQGAEIFYDGRRSLDQWYSCHSCHFQGGINAVTMDTKNDRSDKTFKTVPTLANVTRTAPWTWHGWQTDLRNAMLTSMTETMLGPKPTPHDADALVAYLETLKAPPNPHRAADGSLAEVAERGRKVFESEKAGCIRCHSGPFFTDGKVHDVGLSSPRDQLKGFNTPSLLGVYRRVRLLHDGRAASLEEVLTEHHSPEQVTGLGELTKDELKDLIAYLKSL